MREQRHRILGVAAVATLALAMSACGDDDDAAPAASDPAVTSAPAAADITVSDAWSRQPAEGQTITGVYAVVSNAGDADVTIVAATSPLTDRVELHETLMDADGKMTMQEVDGGFVVPAGGEFVFESGGPHIMMFDIDPATYPSEVQITLVFDAGDPVTFSAEVRSLDGEAMDMGSMDMSDDSAMGDMSESMGDDHDHDMSDESGHDDMSMDDMDHDGMVDAAELHDLDEELAAGTLDAERQGAIVDAAIAQLEAEAPEAGSEQAELLTILQDLKAALAAGDLEAASAAATAAHDASHALEDHDH